MRPYLVNVRIGFKVGEFTYAVYDHSLDAVLADANATYPDAVRISLTVDGRGLVED